MTSVKVFLHSTLVAATLAATGGATVYAGDFSYGKWQISHNDATRRATISKDGNAILNDVTVQFKAGGNMMNTESYNSVKYSTADVADEVGQGKSYTILYTSAEADAPDVEQTFYLYDGKDFVLTDVTLVGKGGAEVASNYIAPVVSRAENLFLPQDLNNRFLTVPFDNDGFVTYGSYPLSKTSKTSTSLAPGRVARDSISFEVTAIFNGVTQQGLVIGSVDHDTWKSAVRMTGSPLSQGKITNLECASGVTHSATRDADGDYLQPHGTVTAPRVKSARMIIHYSDDWRTGLETYGDICAAIAGRQEWTGGTPYGWNSWGGMERHVNFDGVISVSDFIKENIQDKGGFGENGVVFVGLDSFWDNMNWDQLKEFADHCYANGQVPGIYWTPWCDWLFSGSRAVEGNNGYYYEQGYAKVNGKTKSVAGALCMDPTAPATISRLNFFIDKFKMMGFKYIKLDFLTNGIVECDRFYLPEITTGVQAYNYGMKKLRERCGDDMFIVESIAPLFPAQYANARRVSCDAWGEMWHTSYMMNSFSFGWWLNRVYNYNDPDHLVMGNRSVAENISRMTTAAVTGYCMLGDNLSTRGSYIGTEESQNKAARFSTYDKVNQVIQLGGGFRPAYGHILSGANNSVDLFYLETEDSYYIAHFNYEVDNKDITLDLTTLGINGDDIDTSRSYECWTDEGVTINGNEMTYRLITERARLYRLYKK